MSNGAPRPDRRRPQPEAARNEAQLQLFDLAGRTALVVGLGESGLAMARWAAMRGARVRAVDTRADPPGLQAFRAEIAGGQFAALALSSAPLDGVDALLWSPGVSPEVGDAAALHRAARAARIPVLGEIELFAQAIAALGADRPRLVAITGTNGKTTTTRMVAQLCEQAGISAIAAGNIAPAALDALREAIAANAMPEVWVLEVSSFQLALADSLAPDAAAVLNVSEDHLDWHASMPAYVEAKHRIYRAAAVCVFNRDDPATQPRRARSTMSFGRSVPGAPGEFGFVLEGGLRWLAEAVATDEPGVRRRKDAPPAFVVNKLMPADALRVRGTHNQLNALAALALARAVGVPMAAMLHGLRAYAGEAHRCERVSVVRDVEYYDDSKGTNVGATVAALDGLGKRCVLIAGGDGKGQDFGPLARPVRDHARAVILIGRDGPRLREALAGAGVEMRSADTLEQAVQLAASLARAGDAVLLSPACASFDMFRNYGHRAQVFQDAVRRLGTEAGLAC
ncbi:MAG TPA: UDP-N-acetylmuramoyl-L-alanine--D-glutamate ligase [Burkholderiaceae bacterium]